MKRYRDPQTGRYVKADTFFRRVVNYELAAEDAADAVQYAADRLLDARTRRSAQYWERRLTAYREEQRQRQAVYREALRQVQPSKPRKRKTATRRPVERPAPTPKPKAPTAAEWEFGKDYQGKRGKNHAVNVNVRLVFESPVTESQARRAMREIIQGEMPRGVEIHAVDWEARGRSKEGTADDFENFRAIFYTNGVDFLRAGAVKDDTL